MGGCPRLVLLLLARMGHCPHLILLLLAPCGTLSPSDSVSPYGMLSPWDSIPVGPVGPYGMLFPSDFDSVGPCGTLSPSHSTPVGLYGTLSPSDSVGPIGPFGMLSPSDSDSVGPVGPYGMLSPSDPVGPCGTLSPSDSDGPVGPCGTLSPSDSTPVGPVGPYGTLSPSDPVGPYGTLSPSDFDSVGPVGLCGTLSPSDFDFVGHVGTMSPSDSDNVGPVGPFGTTEGPFKMLSMSGAVSDGPTGQVEMTSVVGHRNRLSLVTHSGREISSTDHACQAPGELVPGICADTTASKDPMVPFLPADGPVGDVSHAVDMDVMRNSYLTVPAIRDCRAVVAMLIGLLRCGGSLSGRSDWLYRSSWQAWLADGPGCVRGAVDFFPGGVRIVYVGGEPAGSSSPVTGSLLFYAHVCCLAVCGAAELSLSVVRRDCLCLACWLGIIFPADLCIFGDGGRWCCSGGGPGRHQV